MHWGTGRVGSRNLNLQAAIACIPSATGQACCCWCVGKLAVLSRRIRVDSRTPSRPRGRAQAQDRIARQSADCCAVGERLREPDMWASSCWGLPVMHLCCLPVSRPLRCRGRLRCLGLGLGLGSCGPAGAGPCRGSHQYIVPVSQLLCCGGLHGCEAFKTQLMHGRWRPAGGIKTSSWSARLSRRQRGGVLAAQCWLWALHLLIARQMRCSRSALKSAADCCHVKWSGCGTTCTCTLNFAGHAVWRLCQLIRVQQLTHGNLCQAPRYGTTEHQH